MFELTMLLFFSPGLLQQIKKSNNKCKNRLLCHTFSWCKMWPAICRFQCCCTGYQWNLEWLTRFYFLFLKLCTGKLQLIWVTCYSPTLRLQHSDHQIRSCFPSQRDVWSGKVTVLVLWPGQNCRTTSPTCLISPLSYHKLLNMFLL